MKEKILQQGIVSSAQQRRIGAQLPKTDQTSRQMVASVCTQAASLPLTSKYMTLEHSRAGQNQTWQGPIALSVSIAVNPDLAQRVGKDRGEVICKGGLVPPCR